MSFCDVPVHLYHNHFQSHLFFRDATMYIYDNSTALEQSSY